MKNIIFIGNRLEVLNKIINMNRLKIVHIFVLSHSYLHESQIYKNYEHTVFNVHEKKEILDKIFKLDFDLLISNGCPLIIPISAIKKKEQLFINIHPTYLPFLRGKTPINGVLFNEMHFFGATMHYMDEGIDTGNIIYQEKVEITDDIDLGLLYFMSFKLEGIVFEKGFTILEKHNYSYSGQAQSGEGTYFTRKDEISRVDFRDMTAKEIFKIVRSFGIRSQGTSAMVENVKVKIYDAEIIQNSFLINLFKDLSAGHVLLTYDRKKLVKCKEGIIKIKDYQIVV